MTSGTVNDDGTLFKLDCLFYNRIIQVMCGFLYRVVRLRLFKINYIKGRFLR